MAQPMSSAAATPTRRADPIERIGLGVVVTAAVVLSFSALAGLGRLVGFGDLQLPFGWTFPTALLVPLCIDAYGAVAGRIATNPTYSATTRRHAMIHSGVAIAVGVVGNAFYHLIESDVIALGDVLVTLVIVVSVVPPVALGALVHLISECGRDRQEAAQVHAAGAVPAPAPSRVRDVPGQVREPDDVPAAPLPAPGWPPAEPDPAEQHLLEHLGLPGDEPGPYPARHAQTPPAPAADPAPMLDQVHLPDVDPKLRPVVLQAVETFAPDGRLERVPPLRDIKTALRVGQGKAAQVQEVLNLVAAG